MHTMRVAVFEGAAPAQDGLRAPRRSRGDGRITRRAAGATAKDSLRWVAVRPSPDQPRLDTGFKAADCARASKRIRAWGLAPQASTA